MCLFYESYEHTLGRNKRTEERLTYPFAGLKEAPMKDLKNLPHLGPF